MGFIDQFRKKKKSPAYGLKFIQQMEQRYNLSAGAVVIFTQPKQFQGNVDIIPILAERALFISPLVDQFGPNKRDAQDYKGDIIEVIVNGKRTGSRYTFDAEIEEYARVEPASGRGQELKLKRPAPFFKIKVTSKPKSLDERVDSRYVPPYMIHLIHSMEKTSKLSAVPRYIQSYLQPLRRRAAKGGIRYLPSNVEVRIWNPAGAGKPLPLFDLQEEAIDGPRPPLQALGEGMTPFETHKALVEALQNVFATMKSALPQDKDKAKFEVQLFFTAKTAQKIIKGLPQTQYVNLGPISIDGLQGNIGDKLHIDGSFVMPEDDDGPTSNGLTRRSLLYLTTNIEGKRVICPYRYFFRKGGNKHQLNPVIGAFTDRSWSAEFLDISRSGLRLVVNHEGLENLLGEAVDETAYEYLFEDGDRRIDPDEEAVPKSRKLEDRIRTLYGRFVGINLYLEFHDKDFAIFMGETTNEQGQKKDLYSEHFPPKVAPMVQLLAQVKNIHLNCSEDDVLAFGVSFSHKLLSGEPVPLPGEQEGFCWQKIGARTSHDLVDFTEATKRYHDKRVQVVEHGKGMDAVIAHRVQVDLERQRNSPMSGYWEGSAKPDRPGNMPKPEVKVVTPSKSAKPENAAQRSPKKKAVKPGNPEERIVSMTDRGFFSSLKAIVLNPDKVKLVKKNKPK